MELSPNTYHWHYALFLLSAGEYEEAIETYRRAIERNPLSSPVKTQLGLAFHCAGRERRALEQLERVTELDPDYPRALSLKGEVLQWLGRHREAITQFRRAADLYGVAPERLPRLGVSYAATGRRDEAREVRTVAEQTGAVEEGLPELYVALGDTASALRHLEQALERRFGGLVYLRCRRWLIEHLGDDPRLRRIVEEIGFPTS